MRDTITTDDEGKHVRNASGETVGRIVTVENGTAYVDPDPGMTDTLLSLLGWAEQAEDSDSYALSNDAVETVTDDDVHLTEL